MDAYQYIMKNGTKFFHMSNNEVDENKLSILAHNICEDSDHERPDHLELCYERQIVGGMVRTEGYDI